MNFRRLDFLIAMTLLAAAPASGQTAAPALPDFTGVWAHPFLGFEQPLSGPGPVRNLSRLPSGASNGAQLVGDYNNPILKPEAAALIKKRGEISLSGLAFPDPDNQCLQQPVPYIFWNFHVQILQSKDKVTIIYPHDNDFRQVRLNSSHPAMVIPSPHGDSVGHYEGDTLVIDTIGVKVGPHTTLDRLGTPYTEAIHVVERYRLLDYGAAKAAMDRAEKEWPRVGAYGTDPNYRGKGLQLEFTVEDPGVFTMPWKATVSYMRAQSLEWQERICAENVEHYNGTQYYSDKDARIPTAEKPDF